MIFFHVFLCVYVWVCVLCLFVCNSFILLLLVLLGFNELMNLIYHQFEVDWSSSVGAIVNDIFGPGFAFDVDEYTSCVNYIQQRNRNFQLILKILGLNVFEQKKVESVEVQVVVTYVLAVRIARQRLVVDSREHFCTGNSMLENRVAVNSVPVQDFQHQLDFHLRTIPKSSFAVEKDVKTTNSRFISVREENSG